MVYWIVKQRQAELVVGSRWVLLRRTSTLLWHLFCLESSLPLSVIPTELAIRGLPSPNPGGQEIKQGQYAFIIILEIFNCHWGNRSHSHLKSRFLRMIYLYRHMQSVESTCQRKKPTQRKAKLKASDTKLWWYDLNPWILPWMRLETHLIS